MWKDKFSRSLSRVHATEEREERDQLIRGIEEWSRCASGKLSSRHGGRKREKMPPRPFKKNIRQKLSAESYLRGGEDSLSIWRERCTMARGLL